MNIVFFIIKTHLMYNLNGIKNGTLTYMTPPSFINPDRFFMFFSNNGME